MLPDGKDSCQSPEDSGIDSRANAITTIPATTTTNTTTTVTVPVSPDENMNDSPAKGIFGRKMLRRRSSLFFKNSEKGDETTSISIRETGGRRFDTGGKISIADDESNSSSARQYSGRSAPLQRRKSMYRTRSKTSDQLLKFEVTCEPPPVSLKPILRSSTQQAARRLSMKAKGWSKKKRVRIRSEPDIHDITPRSGKIPGVVKMPDSPPNTRHNLTSTSKIMECDVSGPEAAVIPSDTNASENEEIRFLPSTSIIFPLDDTTEEPIPDDDDDAVEAKNDGKSIDDETVVSFVADENGTSSQSDRTETTKELIAADNLIDITAVAEPVDMNPPSEVKSTTRKTKRHTETNIMWIRGDRLRSRVSSVGEEKMTENKENDFCITCDTTKENVEIQCNKSCAIDVVRNPRPSLRAVLPCAGPCAKVADWLEHMPAQEVQLDELAGNEPKTLDEKPCDDGSNKLRRDAFGILMSKNMSSQKSVFDGFTAPLVETQKKKDTCRRRSLCLQNALNELPVSKRRQTIIVGNMNGGGFGSEDSTSLSSLTGLEKTARPRRRASAIFFTRNKDSVNDNNNDDDDVVLLREKSRTDDTLRNSFARRNKAATGSKKSEEATINTGDVPCSVSQKLENKSVLIEHIDYAPFPSISNVGYAKIVPVNYRLPCALRQQSIPRIESKHDDNSFRMASWEMDYCRKDYYSGNNGAEQNDGIDICSTSKRSKCDRRKRRKSVKMKLPVEELQLNTWTEALRPTKTDELIMDSSLLHDLCQWIGTWKERLQKSRDQKTVIKATTAQRKRHGSESFDSFDSDDDERNLCNTAIVHGPCGSGKTSMVYVIAKQFGMSVLEVASNEKRNGAQLKCKLQGATHSHKLSITSAMSQMFAANGKKKDEKLKDSIILIDDGDVVYDKYDDGYWPALRALCAEARTPIIITCEDIALVRQELGPEIPIVMYPLTRPKPQIASSHLQAVCTAMNIDISTDICTALAEQYNGDLRVCINQLQFYSGADDISNMLSMLMSCRKSGNQREFEMSLKRYRPISYNVTIRYNHSYEPKSSVSSIDYRDDDGRYLEKNEIHEAIKVARSVLPTIEYFPLLDTILDYAPYLCIMNKASRTRKITSRRALHYFDELHGGIQIDPRSTLKNVLPEYSLLTE